MSEWWALALGAAIVVLGYAIWNQANRLDRLHQKVVRSRSTLDAQLARRAGSAAELALSGELDPASSVVVADAAAAAISAGEHPDGPMSFRRAQAESELSHVLRLALGSPEQRAELDDDPVTATLMRSWSRAELARRFHNQAVDQVRHVRRTPLVRWLRLAGHAPMPSTFEADDALPG